MWWWNYCLRHALLLWVMLLLLNGVRSRLPNGDLASGDLASRAKFIEDAQKGIQGPLVLRLKVQRS